MSESLDVYMDGEIIGCLSSGSGQVTFSYDSEYGGVVPLSLSMPLRRRKHSNKAVLPFIWGLLPDNEQALRNMASEAGTSAKSPFGILRVHGADVAGALQILPPGVESSDARRKSVDNAEDILDDKALEGLMLHTLDRYTQRRPDYGEAFKFSIAGAQPKIALSANTSGDFVVPSKDFATTHIVKPNYIDSDYFISDVEATEMVSFLTGAGIYVASGYDLMEYSADVPTAKRLYKRVLELPLENDRSKLDYTIENLRLYECSCHNNHL